MRRGRRWQSNFCTNYSSQCDLLANSRRFRQSIKRDQGSSGANAQTARSQMMASRANLRQCKNTAEEQALIQKNLREEIYERNHMLLTMLGSWLECPTKRIYSVCLHRCISSASWRVLPCSGRASGRSWPICTSRFSSLKTSRYLGDISRGESTFTSGELIVGLANFASARWKLRNCGLSTDVDKAVGTSNLNHDIRLPGTGSGVRGKRNERYVAKGC